MPGQSAVTPSKPALRWMICFILLLLMAVFSACAGTTSTHLPLLTELALTPVPTPLPWPTEASDYPSPVAGWQLAWNDEFAGQAGSSPDPSKWQFDQGGDGWGNRELEYYTNLPENVSIDGNGSLVISALETDPAQRSLDCWYGSCRYTSARILTSELFSFTYGRIEARIQAPTGKGIGPAFWMLGADYKQLGWPACGEIDIMEMVGSNLSSLQGSLHGPSDGAAYTIGSTYRLPNGQSFSHGFHVFGLDWSPTIISWYLDGIPYGSVTPDQLSNADTWVFNKPFFILLNVAVGGNVPGAPDQSTTFPQKLIVDYVRVYQHP